MKVKDIAFYIMCIISIIIILIYYNDYIKLNLPEQSNSNKTIIFDEEVYNELVDVYSKPYESMYILKGKKEGNYIYIDDLEKVIDINKSINFFQPSLFNCKIDNGCLGTIHTHILKNNKRCIMSKQDLYTFGYYNANYGFIIEGIECNPGYFYIIYTDSIIIDFRALKYKIERLK